MSVRCHLPGQVDRGGAFLFTDETLVYRIAQWDGSAWTSLGGGLSDVVNALAVYNDRLVASGYFLSSADFAVPMTRVAELRLAWSATGTGLTGFGTQVNGFALMVFGGDLVVSGPFTIAGGQVSAYLARWGGIGTSVAADFDHDCDVDWGDEAIMAGCATRSSLPYTVPPSMSCTLVPDGGGHLMADFDADGDVDMNDFGRFQRCFGGAGNPPAVGCGF